MNKLTAVDAREATRYDPETGVFTRQVNSYRRSDAGEVLGTLHGPKGYLVANVKGCKVFLHRLAWLHVHGAWPDGQIDHINGDKADNRIANLRDVSASVNSQNKRKGKAGTITGLLGVTWHAQIGKYRAQIEVDGRNLYLGSFEQPEAAHQAYLVAKRQLHEGCSI